MSLSKQRLEKQRRTKGSGFSTTFRLEEVFEAANRASGEALQQGARVITAQAIKNVRKLKLKRPGGYGRVPGYVATQIKTGPTRAKGKPAGSIVLGHPGFQVEYGTNRNRERLFLHRAVQDKKWEVLNILKGNPINE